MFFFLISLHRQPASAQPRFLSVFGSLFNAFRFFFHFAYEGVHHYRPEIRLGRCMFSFARKQYPELRQRFSLDNIQKFVWRMFDDVTTYTSAVISDSQMTETSNRNRIANKVQELLSSSFTGDDDSQLIENQQEFAINRRMDNNMINNNRPLRRVAYRVPRHWRRRRDTNDMDDEFHDLNEKSWEELLDFESVIYESLGIDKKMAKEWTPINCAKEYSVQFVKRFVIEFLKGDIFKR